MEILGQMISPEAIISQAERRNESEEDGEQKDDGEERSSSSSPRMAHTLADLLLEQSKSVIRTRLFEEKEMESGSEWAAENFTHPTSHLDAEKQ